MTANQIAYQKNLIAQDEAATRSREASEQARHNLEDEQRRARELALNTGLKTRELGQELAIAQQKLDQAERENVAKYGTATYAAPGEERGNAREMTNLPFDFFRQIMSALNPLAAIFKGR